MRVLIFTFGTRGDIQPYIGLSCALIKAGHQADILTHPNHKPFIEEVYTFGTHTDKCVVTYVITTALPLLLATGSGEMGAFDSGHSRCIRYKNELGLIGGRPES